MTPKYRLLQDGGSIRDIDQHLHGSTLASYSAVRCRSEPGSAAAASEAHP